ncbi:MAG: hypothetical protein AB7S38_00470 [Vulcanimicrobiota bacterium]
MKLGADFRDLLELLNNHGVRYLVAGGYATSVHSVPRYTKDLDIWLEATPENAHRTLAALTDFGFGGLGLEEPDFTAEDRIIQLGYEPNRVGLLTSLKGLDFTSCYPRRLVVELDGLEVGFLSARDLITNKEAVGRLQDLADVEQLRRFLE